MYICDIAHSFNPYIKSATIATALVLIPVALTIILAVAAGYGHLGTAAQNLIHHQILPHLQGFTGYIPNVSLVTMGCATVTTLGFYTVFSISLSCFKKGEATSNNESKIYLDIDTVSAEIYLDIDTIPIDTVATDHTVDLSNKKWKFPKALFAKNGSLGDQHFLNYAITELKEEEQKPAILWSFSQRKFSSSGLGAWIHDISDDKDGSLYGKLDRYGHAVAQFGGSHSLSFIPKQEDIVETTCCTDYKLIEIDSAALVIGKYQDGNSTKHIIQQPLIGTSEASCLAMLALDNKKALNFRDLSYGLCKLGDTHTITIEKTSALHAAIEKHGPILAEVQDKTIGKHTFIIDSANKGVLGYWANVTIRDPFHGWRITIPHRVLKALQPTFKYVTYESAKN